ncbi:MAG: metallophosphoesterase, partial [Anaerolinea sp.]|nr:metallophosphoesterase [Anaerolinea sp.]
MRLAVFSDIHGNWTAFQAALADFEQVTVNAPVDVIWVLGDLAAFGPRPAECVARVRAWADAAQQAEGTNGAQPARFCAVRGNTDRYLVRGERPTGKPVESEDQLAGQIAAFQRRDQQFHWGLSRLTFADYTFLSKLSPECDLHVPGYGHVIGYHGTPGSDEGMLTPASTDEEAADALLDREGRLGIGGHIHVQMDRTLPTGWRVINAGSVGMS